jgi:hypothetical protein
VSGEHFKPVRAALVGISRPIEQVFAFVSNTEDDTHWVLEP